MNMKKTIPLLLSLAYLVLPHPARSEPGPSGLAPPASGSLTVRTEVFARPPYSGATYYIYAKDGKTICTKLEVCNKYDHCESTYMKGPWKAPEDAEAGTPSDTSPATPIPTNKQKKHVCLVKFNLLQAR
jgi:hypothetical protein